MLRQSVKKLQLSAHSLTLKEVFSLSQSSPKGITEKEAKERLKIFGRNELPEKKPLNFFDFLFSQINNFLVYIIFFSALISLFLKRFIDAFFIILVILLNVIIGAFQEYKAEKTFEKLKKLIKEKVRVIREGREEIISKEEVVPGDVLVLRKGDKVPADARVIESFGLSCNQASLTGEFFPQEKNSEILPLETEITERKNIILASSLVVAGAGKAIVIATGLDSYLGKIYQLLFEKKFREEKSLLQRKIEKFVKLAVRIIISLVFLNGIIALGKGYKFSDVFLASVSLIVSAVPEGLLPLITIVLIFGARNLFRKKSLLRRLSSLETLGSITTIVTDKTGTLTEGKMTLVKILAFAKGKFIPTSKSYRANGIFSSHYLALRTSVLSSDAFIENLDKPAKRMIVRGSPTEKAIVFAGLENGLIKNELLKNLPQIDFLPFDSKIRFSASLNLDKKKKVFLFSLLGSPGVILEKSVKLYDQGKLVKLSEEKRKKIEREINKLTEEGYRVLACAFKEIKKENYQQSTPLKDLSFDLNFLGLLVLEDPLRKESFSTLKILREAGVRTIIATGDVIPARSVNYQTSMKNDFKWSFEKTAAFLTEADLTVINLESPLIPNCPLTNEGMIFCGDPDHREGFLFAGIDVATLANNHILNYGKKGLDSTIKILEDAQIMPVGVKGAEVKDVRGINFAFLAFNDIDYQWSDLINRAAEDKIAPLIKKADREADVVIVLFHWGDEYTGFPNDRQRRLAHLAIDNGADLILGNHPHWVQPVEIYKEKVVVYAHGNFIFDQMWSDETKRGVVGKYM